MITKLNQTLWEAVLLKGALERLAYNKVVRDQGQINGATLNLQNIGAVNVGNYTKDTDITNQVLTDTQKVIDLDQQKYFSVALDDVDAAQTNSAVMAEVARKGAAGLAKAADTYIATIGAAGASITADLGTSGTPLEINSANVAGTLSLIARRLEDANADMESLWTVLPPFVIEDLRNASIGFLSDNMQLGVDGFAGKLYGLHIYSSNNVINNASTEYQILAGDKDCITFGHNIQKVEGLRNPKQFGDILRALYVYGGVVSQPETLALGYFNEAVDS